MYEVDVAIEGTTPLILNKFTDQAAMSATVGTRASTVGSKGTPLEQAASKLYRSAHDDDVLIIPSPNLFRAIIDAGKFFKAGKSKVTTHKSSLIPACLDLGPIEIVIKHKEPWTVDTRAVRIPSTGGRILAHRPCFYDWRLEFNLALDTEVISDRLLRDIVDVCGKRIGLGDFRPDCKGPFGKFVVAEWRVESNGSPKD